MTAAYRPPASDDRPVLTSDMIREYARANPSQARYADLALRGCHTSRREIAAELGCRSGVPFPNWRP